MPACIFVCRPYSAVKVRPSACASETEGEKKEREKSETKRGRRKELHGEQEDRKL